MADDLVLGSSDDLESVAPEWDELADRAHASPFVRPGWVRAWREAFGVGDLVIFTARAEGRLVGVVPLERRRGGFHSPTNAHSPETALLAESGHVAEMLLGEVFLARAHVLVVGPLDRSSDTLAAVRDRARRAGYRQLVRTVSRPPYIHGSRTLAEYEHALSRNLRHDVERRLRRLYEQGAVSVQVVSGGPGLAELLEEGFAVEAAGWKGRGGTAIASEASTREFYRDVARWAAQCGWLRLAFLRLDSRAIAFQLDLETEDAYYSLKIGYDPAYDRFAPGKLLLYLLASRAMSRGLERYELLGTDEPWKRRWADASHERVTLHAFASSPTGRVARYAFVARRSLARRLPFARRAAAVVRR